jgi:hypothetical protein
MRTLSQLFYVGVAIPSKDAGLTPQVSNARPRFLRTCFLAPAGQRAGRLHGTGAATRVRNRQSASLGRRIQRVRHSSTLLALVPMLPSLDRLPSADELVTFLFQVSIIPYAGFLYVLWTRERTLTTITKIGLSYLLVFVLGTIVAGVIALRVYHEKLANVDYLHGTAEMLLTMTNICILMGVKDQALNEDAGE